MPVMIIRHRVKDYARWKPVFDAHEDARRRAGVIGHALYRAHDEPNDIVIVVECTDLERARAFAESADLREAMQRAGVEGTPSFWYLETLEQMSYGARREAPELQPRH